MELNSSGFSDQIKPFIQPQQDCQYAVAKKGCDLKRAAVLIPLVDTADQGLSILLTTRTQHLHHHAGQISLPGGMLDQTSDLTPVDTAIRETHEETGISAEFIDIVGALDHYPTNSGFVVTPIVGRILQGFSLQADPFEVDEIFTVPLNFIFDHRNHQKRTYKDKDRSSFYYQISYENKRIWGITAAILVNFYKRLKDNHPLFCELVPQNN
ncbi:MAG: CoA pyrophosphatase [Gammaproteobacteria bacterium]